MEEHKKAQRGVKMPESSGGVVPLGMVAMFASMFPGMVPAGEWKGLDGQGVDKLSQKSMQEIYLEMIGIKDEAVQGRLPGVKGLIEPVTIEQEDLEKNPDVQTIAKKTMITTTTVPTVEVWQGGGYEAFYRVVAEAEGTPGSNRAGFATETTSQSGNSNTWIAHAGIAPDKTINTLAATGNPEIGFAA